MGESPDLNSTLVSKWFPETNLRITLRVAGKTITLAAIFCDSLAMGRCRESANCTTSPWKGRRDYLRALLSNPGYAVVCSSFYSDLDLPPLSA